MTTQTTKPLDLSFEQALEQLEAIVQGMEQGRLPLEDSLAKYEQGMNLAAFCADLLGKAEKKIEILQKQRDGSQQFQPWREGQQEMNSDSQ